MPTYEDALDHLGIDYPDETIKRLVTRKLAAAIKILHDTVGEDVETLLPDDPRAAELVLEYLDDLYSQRGTSAKVTGATRQRTAGMELQLILALRRLREGADA